MASGIDLGGDRPPNIVYLSGEANPLNLAPHDRRFWVAAPDMPVPAPANWPARPTDKPVLRNELWEAFRNHARGTWTVAVYPQQGSTVSLCTQDYVVDDCGNLHELTGSAAEANTDWYTSTYCIDQAACEWMDQWSAPLRYGSALHAMHQAAQASRPQQPAPQEDVQAIRLPEPYYPGHAATLLVQDDPHWRSRDPLYSVLLEHDDDRLVLTARQVRALAHALAQLATTMPEGSPQ